MSQFLLDLIHQVIGSPWLYLVLFTLTAADGFFPAVPGETAVVTAAVFAATAEPNLPIVIAVSTLGAFAGDHISYLIGRGVGGGLVRRLRPDSRRRVPVDWAAKTLAERGGIVLVGTRYVPGVRTATTFAAGTVGYALRRFTPLDSVAAAVWASGWALVGYLGGAAYGDDPIKGLLLGLGIAAALTTLVEAVRRPLSRRRQRRPTPLRRR